MIVWHFVEIMMEEINGQTNFRSQGLTGREDQKSDHRGQASALCLRRDLKIQLRDSDFCMVRLHHLTIESLAVVLLHFEGVSDSTGLCPASELHLTVALITEWTFKCHEHNLSEVRDFCEKKSGGALHKNHIG
jgi:hypothetical protein